MENKSTNSKPNLLLKGLYRKLSGNLLGLAVKSQVIGDVPVVPTNPDDNASADNLPLTFYVLKEYSRSNSLLDRKSVV